MTIEDKELLLKDLCSRLPYGVQTLADLDKEFDGGVIGRLVGIVPTGKKDDIQGHLFYQETCLTPFTIEEIRPYLRPMSSMTEEERKEYQKFLFPCPDYDGRVVVGVYHRDLYKVYDYLNSRHFDYHGLIEKGLAIEAPEGIYNHYNS